MERAAWVALSAVSGLGPARFRALLDAFGSPTAALDAGGDAIAETISLPESAFAELAGIAGELERIEAEVLSLEEQGISALTWEDAEYPRRLLATASPPPVLWWRSEGCSTDPEAAAAVVGSREVSEPGRAEAYAVGQALARAGIAVVSGLAAGIDAAAHEGALDCGGPTVGVCGCGLLTALARGGGGLAQRMAEGGGLCSELSPTAPLAPKTLFARDRIIAGLADAVIVVEARAEGGAVHTAKCARQEGRPVLAVAWESDHLAPGNRQLLGGGATRVEAGADVAAAFADIIRG
ncbi:MAG TPA: DNA-processing protein DprA [Armatimonadota bacterium]|nr:DNA-processing protein DprA [Armatimonadota bacterium]